MGLKLGGAKWSWGKRARGDRSMNAGYSSVRPLNSILPGGGGVGIGKTGHTDLGQDNIF
jgi:hypothetical protein